MPVGDRASNLSGPQPAPQVIPAAPPVAVPPLTASPGAENDAAFSLARRPQESIGT